MKKVILGLFFFSSFLYGQQTAATKTQDNHIFNGNLSHQEKSFSTAELHYRKALSEAPSNVIAHHNMGNSLYESKLMGEAFNSFKTAVNQSEQKAEKHSALHNLGNVFMKNKDYSRAAETYKEALRNDPTDNETRYNYALAKKLMKDQEQKQDQDKDQDQDQDKKKNQDQDKKDPNQEKDSDKDEQEDDNGQPKDEPSDKKEPQDPKENTPQPNPTQLSPQQIQSLLEAMSKEEKKVQEKVQEQKVKPIKPKSKIDW